ncbi:GTP cyclohydrolase II [Candidatus Binatia bacterium]|nr:GTP cyclohydrolase II [Candidatus Binatia bacterium]
MSASHGELPARHAVAGQMLHRGVVPLDTTHGPFAAHVLQNVASGSFAIALARGDLRGAMPLLARIHSSCVTSETFGGCDCDCVEQLDLALAHIADEDRGVVFYLMQEGRGAGFAAKARDRMLVQASRNRLTTFEAYERMGLGHDQRRYDEVGHACALLGVAAPLVLLTNNPDKLTALSDLGIAVAGSARLRQPASPYNQHYLAAKSRSGHALGDAADGPGAAELPEPVTDFAPYALPDAPRFVHLARYLLPVRLRGEPAPSGPYWFRVHAYFDLTDGRERVVLAYGPPDAPSPLVRVQHESLLERFPRATGAVHKPLWHETVRRMVEHGAGYTAFVPIAGFDPQLREPVVDDDASAALLAHHLRGRTAHVLPDAALAGSSGDGDDAVTAGATKILTNGSAAAATVANGDVAAATAVSGDAVATGLTSGDGAATMRALRLLGVVVEAAAPLRRPGVGAPRGDA